jgi:hypothetical protein
MIRTQVSRLFILISFLTLFLPLRAEDLRFNLYLNVGFINIQAGSAHIYDRDVIFNGQDALLLAMEMSTDNRADRIFTIRDTVESYNSNADESLYFRKTINEGDKHVVETALFSKDNGHFIANMTKMNNATGKRIAHTTEWRDSRIYDVMSMLKFARSMDTSGSEPGRTESIPMVNGDQVITQYLVYTGNKQVKADDGRTYDCMIVSVRDYKEGKERETLKAYVTNDSLHKPVQLDINLGIGTTIKALLK